MLLTLNESWCNGGEFGTPGSAVSMTSRRYPSVRRSSDRSMNKPEVIESGLPSPGLLPQAIAFVRDFAAFAGIRGVVAAELAVVAASFEGAGLLLLVPLLSLITVSDTGT